MECLFHIICSELHGWLLNWQKVKSLLALHSFLLVWVIRRESGWMGTLGGILIFVMELNQGIEIKIRPSFALKLTLKV